MKMNGLMMAISISIRDILKITKRAQSFTKIKVNILVLGTKINVKVKEF